MVRYIYGAAGETVYSFKQGDGNIDIYNGDGDALGTFQDRLALGEGIALSDVTIARNGDHLVVTLKQTEETCTVRQYFGDDTANAIEFISFQDGTQLDIPQIKALVLQGTAGNDVLQGDDSDETLNGLGGSDEIDGGGGNDRLFGGDGHDFLTDNDGINQLYGESGDDTLRGRADSLYDSLGESLGSYFDGGTGDDSIWGAGTLVGGAGQDELVGYSGDTTYLFNKGFGQDVITNGYADGSDFGDSWDRISFGAGIASGGVAVKRAGDDLVLTVTATDDSVSVRNYFNVYYGFRDAPSGWTVEEMT